MTMCVIIYALKVGCGQIPFLLTHSFFLIPITLSYYTNFCAKESCCHFCKYIYIYLKKKFCDIVESTVCVSAGFRSFAPALFYIAISYLLFLFCSLFGVCVFLACFVCVLVLAL